MATSRRDPAEEAADLAAIEAELFDELRHNSVIRGLFQKWLEARRSLHVRRLTAPLLNEREGDTLRGRIAELQSAADMIHNGGNDD